MTPEVQQQCAVLATRHGIGPGRIASTLDLFVGDVARLFDSPSFQDAVKQAEDTIVQHCLDHLHEMNVPVQRVRVEMSRLSHAGRVRRARQLLAQHIHPSRRWP